MAIEHIKTFMLADNTDLIPEDKTLVQGLAIMTSHAKFHYITEFERILNKMYNMDPMQLTKYAQTTVKELAEERRKLGIGDQYETMVEKLDTEIAVAETQSTSESSEDNNGVSIGAKVGISKPLGGIITD